MLLDGKDFDIVTMSDAMGKTFKTEVFVDGDCNPKMDATGAVLTSFDGWYDYNMMTNQLTPHPGTWLVKGGGGRGGRAPCPAGARVASAETRSVAREAKRYWCIGFVALFSSW